MSLVKLRYLEGERQIEEICTLVAREGGASADAGGSRSVQIPGKFLFEDDFGLWYLDQDRIISMEPATRCERDGHVWWT